jgi:hypothetical protein
MLPVLKGVHQCNDPTPGPDGDADAGVLQPTAIQHEMGPPQWGVERLYLTSVSGTITGGTSEIQRHIIAERGLGLPR